MPHPTPNATAPPTATSQTTGHAPPSNAPAGSTPGSAPAPPPAATPHPPAPQSSYPPAPPPASTNSPHSSPSHFPRPYRPSLSAACRQLGAAPFCFLKGAVFDFSQSSRSTPNQMCMLPQKLFTREGTALAVPKRTP